MKFDQKTAVVALISLLMLGIISFLAFYDFSARFSEKSIKSSESTQQELQVQKEEFDLLKKQLDGDWKSLERAFKDNDYRRARLILNNFLYVRDKFRLPEKYQKVNKIEERLKKIEQERMRYPESLPEYERLTFLAGAVYGKKTPTTNKKRKEVWIAVQDTIPPSLIEQLGARVLLEEREDFDWVTLYVQKASDKQGMAIAIFDLKEGIYRSFLTPEKN